MDTILIQDIEVRFRVGVPDEERAEPQRLLISVELELDCGAAAKTDDLGRTVNYFDVYHSITRLGDNREWKLIETLAEEIAALAMNHELVQVARVEVKKFILPNTRHVAVRIERERAG